MKKIIVAALMSVALVGCSVTQEKAIDAVNAAASVSYLASNYEQVKVKINEGGYTEEEKAKLAKLEVILDSLYSSIGEMKSSEGDFADKALSAQQVIELYTLSKIAYKQASDIILPRVSQIEDPFIQRDIQKFHQAALRLDSSIKSLLSATGKDHAQLAVDALEITVTIVRLLSV